MAQGRCFVGTSGWSYKHWRGPFYPSGMSKGGDAAALLCRALRHGRGQRHLLPADRGRDASAAGARRRRRASSSPARAAAILTHMKRLKDPEQGVAGFFERVEALADKLGPIVFQLPGRFKPDRERLAGVPRRRCRPRTATPSSSATRPGSGPRSWTRSQSARSALCLYEFAGREAPLEVTADFVYIRLHGPDGPYQGSYGDAALGTWAERIRGWAERGPRRLLLLRQRRARLRARERLAIDRVGQDGMTAGVTSD